MALTKAEKQKAYRERKKQKDGEAYYERERNRVKKYYVPIEERSKKEKAARRKKVCAYVKQHREKKKLRSNEVENVVSENVTENSTEKQCGEVSSSTDTIERPQRLIVKMPCQDKKKRTRTRTSRAVAKCKRQTERLSNENKNIERSYKRVSKRYERLVKRASKSSTQISVSADVHMDSIIDVHFDEPMDTEPSGSVTTEYANVPVADQSAELNTPRKRAYAELRNEGVTQSKLQKSVKDKLVLTNVLTDEINQIYKESNEQGKAIVSNIISSDKLKKYKLKRTLSIKTGISRQRLQRKTDIKLTNMRRRKRNERKRQELRHEIGEFLERDDNSRAMPGKNDKVKTTEGHVQKRVLNDSMVCLHLKYRAERTTQISFSAFCKLRPKHIALTKYLSRNKCLCQKHQNMALALKAMKSAGADVPINPDEFSRKLMDTPADTFLTAITEEEVSYPQWKKVKMPDGKMKTKIVERKLKLEEFITIVSEQICEFQQHVGRVKTQYSVVKNLKENLPSGHAMIQMDFAENYCCNAADEVHSAYWNSSAVTLHPIVAYFKDDKDALAHENFVYVSDDLGHNFGTVYTIIEDIVNRLKDTVTDLQMIHYWTDSPSSQYRNKSAFYVVSDHERLLGVTAIWNSFETGHGKGPCDGIGGTAKRTADMAIKQGKITVQDATDFYENVQPLHKSAKYCFVSSSEIEAVRKEIGEINLSLKAVKGTMQVHQVASMSTGKVKTCTTSCYCQECIHGNLHGYSEGLLTKSRSVHRAARVSADQVNKDMGMGEGNPERMGHTETIGDQYVEQNDPGAEKSGQDHEKIYKNITLKSSMSRYERVPKYILELIWPRYIIQ